MQEMITTTTTTFEKITKAGAITPTTLNGFPGMSSLEIAEITGKRHDRVLKDARKMLEELGFLHRIEFGDGKSRYELATGDSAHAHHHLICLSCGVVTEFGDDLLETLESFVSRTADFQITDHQVKFYGYCRECRNKNEQ